MHAGSIVLADLVDRIAVLSVTCTRCPRSGRYPLASLLERHGADYGIPELLRHLSGDCPKRQSVTPYDQCGIHCPELPALFDPGRTV